MARYPRGARSGRRRRTRRRRLRPCRQASPPSCDRVLACRLLGASRRRRPGRPVRRRRRSTGVGQSSTVGEGHRSGDRRHARRGTATHRCRTRSPPEQGAASVVAFRSVRVARTDEREVPRRAGWSQRERSESPSSRDRRSALGSRPLGVLLVEARKGPGSKGGAAARAAIAVGSRP